MADRVMTAEAIITAKDGTGDVFAKIASKLAQVGKGAKASAEIDRMAKSLERAQAQLKAIQKFEGARGTFADARARYRDTQLAVERAARALSSAEKPTKALEIAYRNAQRAVAGAASAFEAQKTAVLASKRALESFGAPIGKVVSEQARLRASVEQTSAALARQGAIEERQAAAGRRRAARLGELRGAAVLAGIGIAHGAERFGHASLQTYREFDKERRFAKAVMGISDDEQAPLIAQAIQGGATTKFNDIQFLEGQRALAARGLKRDQILGLMSPAADLGQALDLSLPDSVKQMEGAIFGFKKDISTLAAAIASARQTADVQVKAAKISGLTPEDITQTYKYSATPARLSGVNEQTVLAFAGVLKKANIGGDEAGVAFRALIAAGQSPTRKAKEALLANGLNYKNYQRSPDKLALDPFVQNIAAQYGVRLDKRAQGALGGVFSNKELISDPAKFAPAVTSILRSILSGSDAKSLKSIAGAANRYRDASIGGIDMNAFIRDLMEKIPGNLQLSNAVFGSKQGGRIATGLGDPETFKGFIDALLNHSEGFAKQVSDERMAGFDGAVSRFEGAIKNLETAIGRSWDAEGKGGALTSFTDMLAKATQGLATMDSTTLQVGTGLAGLAAGLLGINSFINLGKLLTGGGLTESAAALDVSAGLLNEAAVALGAKGIAPVAGGTAAGIAGGAAAGAGAGAGLLGSAGLGGLVGVMWKRVLPAFGAYSLGTWGIDKLLDLLPRPAGPVGPTSGWQAAKDLMAISPAFDGRSVQPIPGGRAPSLPASFGEPKDGFGLDGSKIGGGGRVQAELKGSAEVSGQATVTIVVQAGSDLIRIEQALKDALVKLSGSLAANGPGSVGHSSPDAGPGVGSGSGRMGHQ